MSLTDLFKTEDMESLQDVLVDELKDLYSAESQLIAALPKMAEKASHVKLKRAFQSHLVETKNQLKRLDKIAKIIDTKLNGKTCKAMKGLIEEGKEAMKQDGKPSLVDALLIGAAQRVEHYEIAAYGTARAISRHLGMQEVSRLLDETIKEEGAADKALTAISERDILPASRGRGLTKSAAPKAGVGRRGSSSYLSSNA